MNEFLTIPWFRWDPIMLGDLPIQPFGILVAIGVLLGAKVADLFARRNDLNPQLVADMVAHVVIFGFVFGYFLNAAAYEPEVYVRQYDELKELLATGNFDTYDCEYLGLSSYGGFFGAMLGLFVWKWRRNVPVLPFADAAVFGLPFGWFFGRMGCFVVHDHPGRPTDFFLGVEEYIVHDAGGHQLERVTRHDLGLYEVIWSLGCVILVLILGRERRPHGFYAALLPILYAPIRFFLDYLRADADSGGDVRYFGITPGQYASIAMFLVGAGIFAWMRYHGPYELGPDLRNTVPAEEPGGKASPGKKRGKPKGKKAADKAASGD